MICVTLVQSALASLFFKALVLRFGVTLGA